MRVLIVTSVPAERNAVLRGLGLPMLAVEEAVAAGHRTVVATGGVGVAAATATTTWLLRDQYRQDPFDLVVCAGVAGGFAGRVPVAGTVLARRCVAADLGAESPHGLLTLEDLHLGQSTVEMNAAVLARLHKRLAHATIGDVLTVSTVTGTAQRAAALLTRHPDAVAEAMEGFGVAAAARRAGAAWAEVRTISNPVGPRDRTAWDLTGALAALTQTAAALADLD